MGWEKCGHGLTSRPRETGTEAFLHELLLLFRFPARSAPALLGGDLPLMYCAAGFANKLPTWRLPPGGSVADLITEGGVEAGIVHFEPGGDGVDWVSGGKRVGLNRKTPAHLVRHGFFGISISATCVEEIRCTRQLGWCSC